MKPNPLLKHWACAKISKSRPSITATDSGVELNGDDEICLVIVEKFEALGGVDVSYAEIAKKAWEAGWMGLATKVCIHHLYSWSISYSELSSFQTMNQELPIRYPYCSRRRKTNLLSSKLSIVAIQTLVRCPTLEPLPKI